MDFEPIEGGCQCGAVRYRVSAAPREVLHCHCSMCRKAHGALFATSGFYDDGALEITRGADSLSDYRSSPGTHRLFCSSCGCQLFNRIEKWPDAVFVMLGTLDSGVVPGHDPATERHIFWDSRARWYDVGDDGLARAAGYPG